MSDGFPASKESFPKVKFYFGVKDIDPLDSNYWNSSFYGEAIMDPKFDMKSVESQKFLIKFCDELEK